MVKFPEFLIPFYCKPSLFPMSLAQIFKYLILKLFDFGSFSLFPFIPLLVEIKNILCLSK